MSAFTPFANPHAICLAAPQAIVASLGNLLNSNRSPRYVREIQNCVSLIFRAQSGAAGARCGEKQNVALWGVHCAAAWLCRVEYVSDMCADRIVGAGAHDGRGYLER
jgi:hypothetical protein